MSKVAIVFWSQTGNTETMANCIAEGAGANATIIPCSEMNAAKLGEYDVVAFGCPAMGAEQLEESEFEPMFSDLEGSLNGKKVAMFGSYGWGDNTAMQVDAISTGSLGLDMALGVGGVPRGRIIEVYGPESSGKTTLPGRRLYGQRSGRAENGNERSGGERLTGRSNALRCRSRCP